MTRTRLGFTLVELLIAVAVIGTLAAIALPGLMRARISGNEASAIGSMRAIYSGEQAFCSACGRGHYAPSLQNLGLPVGGSPGFISSDLSGLAPITKSGYRIDLGTDAPVGDISCNGGTMAMSYHATADPLSGQGIRYFGGNAGGTIFESTVTLVGIVPDSGAPPAPARPIQ